MKDTVCVTGGSGGIGQALLEQLVDRYNVKVLFRSSSAISEQWLRRGCAPVWGDLSDEAALAQLVAGARFVFHCAAVTQGSYDEAHAVNVEGTRRLARAAVTHGCQRFIHVSSIAVYRAAPFAAEFTEDAELSDDEDLPVYCRTKLQAEQAVVDVARTSGLEYVILRPTSVYGPNIKSYTIAPLDLIRKGLPVVIGPGNGLLDVVFVDDVARALVLAAQSSRANGEIFNVGHETVTFGQFYAHYGRMLNRSIRHLPLGLVNGVVRLLRVAGTRKPRAREMYKGARFLVWMAASTSRVSSEKAIALLGYAPQVSLTLGMLKTELWAKQEWGIAPADQHLDGYGTLPFRPVAVVHPSSEREIVEIVQVAAASGSKVRAIGSLHSQCPLPYTDGVCVVLDRYTQLVQVDGHLVTVQAGMTIRQLNDRLAELKLALPTNGSITAQTVSGAISTATHGGSIFHGSVSDCVDAVRIVRADGQVVGIDRTHSLFDAAVVSLGCLGIFSTVTFRCVDAFVLQSRSTVKDASQVVAEFDALQRRSLYTCMLYFAAVDRMEILSIDRSDAATTLDELPVRRAGSSGFLVSKPGQRLARAAVKGLAWLLRRHHAIQRYFTSLSVGSSYQVRIGRSDAVLAFTDAVTSGRSPMILQDMELAIPYDRAPAVIELLRAHFRRTGRYPLMPMHIRCSAGSSSWLSPAYKRDVCWFEFWEQPGEGFLTEIHELLKPLGYRFHWGKQARADRAYIRQQYERWDDFIALRREWDPQGMFLNTYTEAFLVAAEDTLAS